MCCPFTLRHFLTRSGMPHINRSKVSGEIADHALFTFWIKPFRLVAAGILSSSCWMMAYKFSIIFKSGEFPGHWSFVQKELTFDWSHRWVMIAVWLGALSCIKIASDLSGMNFFSKVEPMARERRIAGRKRLLEDLRHLILGSHSHFFRHNMQLRECTGRHCSPNHYFCCKFDSWRRINIFPVSHPNTVFFCWKWGNPQCFHWPLGFWPMGGLGISSVPHLTITSPLVKQVVFQSLELQGVPISPQRLSSCSCPVS